MQHYQRIRDLREDNDLTQEALCKKLYMHKTTYTNYEQGKHTVPLDFAVLLADFYDVSIDYIAGRTNTMKNGSVISLPKDVMDVLQNTAPSPSGTRASWNCSWTPSANSRARKKKRNHPCKIEKAVPRSETFPGIRLFVRLIL